MHEYHYIRDHFVRGLGCTHISAMPPTLFLPDLQYDFGIGVRFARRSDFPSSGKPVHEFFLSPYMDCILQSVDLDMLSRVKGIEGKRIYLGHYHNYPGPGFPPPLPLSVTPGRTPHCHSPVRVYHVLTDYTC